VPPLRPRLETLERRAVLSTLTVTNNQESGAGSLRAAIKAAASGNMAPKDMHSPRGHAPKCGDPRR
jgi:hypothetical protein